MRNTLILGDPTIRSIVYCYAFPSVADRVKIGMSRRGMQRIADQSTAFPEKPRILFLIHHPAADEIEAEIHAILAASRADTIGREWFSISDRRAERIAVAAARRWGAIPRTLLSRLLRVAAGGAIAWSLAAIVGVIATAILWSLDEGAGGRFGAAGLLQYLIIQVPSKPGGLIWWLNPLSSGSRWTTETAALTLGAFIPSALLMVHATRRRRQTPRIHRKK